MASYKQQQTEEFFKLHPDAVLVEILDGAEGEVLDDFPALFDMAHDVTKGGGDGVAIKYVPHVTFYSGHADAIRTRGTWLRIGAKEWQVFRVDDDLTLSTYQAEAWLL